MNKRSKLWFTSALAASALFLGACSGGGDTAPTTGTTGNDTAAPTTGTSEAAPAEGGTITFWTPQTSPGRLAVQEKIAADFKEQSGITVQVVPMAGADQNQALVTGSASGDVPDVILHAPDQTAAWTAQGLLNTDIATQIVESLDRSTFNEAALDFVTLNDTISAVPSDGWSQVIVYRTDLFEANNIEVPTSLEELADAAEALKAAGVSGIGLGTQAGTPSATEGTEGMLLPGGCQMFDNGTVTFDSPECVDGLAQFKRLAESSLAGEFDVTAARAAYLNGDAGMLLFSTHILDELAGIDESTPPTCPECGDNPRFLAENSAFITQLDPDNPAQYGTVLNYGVPTGANADAAAQWIEYLLNDGYIENLSMAAEGRIPVRNGTPEEPEKFINEWGQLRFGDEGNTDSIADIYGEETVEALKNGVASVSRWGYGTPDAAVAGAAFAQGVVASQLEALYAGTDPAEVAATIKSEIEALQVEFGDQ